MRPRARWYGLCLDAPVDAGAARRLGAFWAAVVGGEHVSTADDPAGEVVVPGREGLGLALVPVPDARSVKHRVHLDVYAGAVADLEALGATVLRPAEETGLGWTVMADPDGGEFCAFLREPDRLPAYRLHGIVVDCADAERVARWWGEVFGVEPRHHAEHGWWSLEGVTPDLVLTLDFVPVPEPKTVKNRVHWDVFGDVGELEAAGARVLRRRDEEISWDVLADPEGNEFCVFAFRDESP